MTSKEEDKVELGLSDITQETLSQSASTLAELKLLKDTKSPEGDPDTLCGFGSWTPQWIQKAAEPKLFLFFYSMCGITESATFSYLVGCMSTMEKRFSYDTKMSSIILITVDVLSIFFGAFVGYFGGLAHRPRMLAYGLLMSALGTFVFSIPYFVYGSGRLDENLQSSATRISGETAQLCDKDLNKIGESCNQSSAVSVVAFFFVGNFLRSIAIVTFYTVGPSYIDDSIKKKNSPVYFGITFALHLLGPVLGHTLSSICLQFYEDPFYDPGFGTTDPRWVGAWWLGFIILGVLILIFSAPMILFPKRFPKKKIPSTLQKEKPEEEPKSTIQQLKDMATAMKRLVKNPILMCQYLGTVLRTNGYVGYYMLLPKYLEMQFRQSASAANLYSGPASIVGMQIGILLGGIAIQKFLPRPRVLTGGIAITQFFAAITLVSCMLISCPIDQLAGTSTDASPLINLENECNTDCMCTTKVYTPVCGPDGRSTYFSPCFAGCTGNNKTGETELFVDCKCVHNEDGTFTVGNANKDYCGFECQWLITFIVILSLGELVSSTASVGNGILILRCVDPKDKSIALGASSGIFALLAFIPSPLIYGALTDTCCLVWEENCGKTGNCWVYDTDKFRFLLHGLSAAFLFLGCLTDVFVWFLSPRLRNLYDDDDEEKE